jgi:hypothetical protein
MPANNLRIIYDNAINKASVTASSTAGSLVASNLLSDLKSQVWRSTGTAPTLTFTWATAQIIAGFALVFTNLTSSATIRARGYTETTDPTPVFDTGNVAAVPSALGEFNWGISPLGVNAYAYGGGSTGVLWMAATAIKKLVINISDPTNTAGFVEASRAVAGAYFSPVYNVQYGGLKVGAEDTSKHDRSAAGDLLTDRGVMYKTLDIDLQLMPHVDRNTVWQILRGNGMSRPVFVSVLPESEDDINGEQIYTIYGKLSRTSALTYAAYNQHSAPLQIEEI